MCAPPGRAEAGAPTVAKVIAAALREPPALCAHVWKTLNAILCCRTPALGSHCYRCADCGRDHVVPHSCRNRHCPRCQGANADAWLDRQEEDLLPVPYFHVVFTLPLTLNPLILQNPRALHSLLFDSVSATLLEFAHNKFGVRPGITVVLHTWGQALLDHSHLHCIVTGGGLSADGQRWRGITPNYLFPVRALSVVFAAKYREGLMALFAEGKLEFHGQLAALADPRAFARLVRTACRTKWNVYAKRPFGGPKQVLAYLSRYTHRIAIGDRRIVQIDEHARTVTFAYKDYADHNQRKTMTLSLREFLRRFCLHILPCGFVKIGHYGLLANRGRHQPVAQARQLITPEDDPPKDDAIVAEPTEPSAARPACPYCGSLRLLLMAVILPSRSRPRCDSS
ncbi:MAG: IS91 family transposase [Chthoniobacterales bacterium]|nr:IS91 family transposase [Chthoniobacterales bacterium]